MDTIQKAFEDQLLAIPKRALEAQIEKKLKAIGEETPPGWAAGLAEHILAGHSEPYIVGADGANRTISLSFSDAEISQIAEPLERFLQNDLAKVTEEVCVSGAKAILRRLLAESPAHSAYERLRESGFKERLLTRWAKPLDLLRMILTIARELGEKHLTAYRAPRSKKAAFAHYALALLHVRSCRVTSEVIALIEAGYADAAMSRWRTLHETSIIALLVADFGDDLAERYLAHEIVEAKRIQDEYMQVQVPLGAPPPKARDIANLQRKMDAAVTKFGKEFAGSYGWAAHALKLKRVTFVHLERAAGQSIARLDYKIASLDVHTSSRGLVALLRQPRC